jgi:hypothetical protein
MEHTFVYGWSDSVRHDDDVTIAVATRVSLTSASVGTRHGKVDNG